MKLNLESSDCIYTARPQTTTTDEILECTRYVYMDTAYRT